MPPPLPTHLHVGDHTLFEGSVISPSFYPFPGQRPHGYLWASNMRVCLELDLENVGSIDVPQFTFHCGGDWGSAGLSSSKDTGSVFPPDQETHHVQPKPQSGEMQSPLQRSEGAQLG